MCLAPSKKSNKSHSCLEKGIYYRFRICFWITEFNKRLTLLWVLTRDEYQHVYYRSGNRKEGNPE